MRTCIVLGVIVAMTMGCSGALTQGVQAYDAGRYSEALERLAAVEPEMGTMNPEARARYALHRGLTHLALGDRESADRWIAEAKWCWDSDRKVLNDRERGRLIAAWEALGHARGEWGEEVLRQRGVLLTAPVQSPK